MFALRCHLPNHTNGGALHVHVVRPAEIFANIGTFLNLCGCHLEKKKKRKEKEQKKTKGKRRKRKKRENDSNLCIVSITLYLCSLNHVFASYSYPSRTKSNKQTPHIFFKRQE
jgi:hypothetical protein